MKQYTPKQYVQPALRNGDLSNAKFLACKFIKIQIEIHFWVGVPSRH